MLLDNIFTYDQKVIFSLICGGIWIYLNYYEPLFLPIGLLILFGYSLYTTKNK